MKTHRYHTCAVKSNFKRKNRILSPTFAVEKNPWRQVAVIGCKRFRSVRARVWKQYAGALPSAPAVLQLGALEGFGIRLRPAVVDLWLYVELDCLPG